MSSTTCYELTMPETYHRTGFFNVPVAFDRQVRATPGPITIRVEPEGRSFEAQVNRTANPNRTARVMGGVPLRDWFQLHSSVGQSVFIRFDSPSAITVSTRRPTAS